MASSRPPRVTLGYHCSHEQYGPSDLLDNVRAAEQAGFSAAMCSDHFHPWSERQGHSGFTWTWLGAAMQATRCSFGTVCAPGQRYHPAIIAQASAALAEMFPERFWLAVGSGEALNESITGAPWPAKDVRNARLKECVDVMRALWAGETVTHRGAITVVDATLYSRPARPPLVVGAALSAETARFLGRWADALVTIAAERDRMRAIVDAFREGGGEGKPLFLQVALSYADSDERAVAAAHDQWRQAALDAKQLADVPTPREFDRATAAITPEAIAGKIRCSSDIARHLALLEEDADMGFERLYLHNVNRDTQREFIDACAARVLPAFGQ